MTLDTMARLYMAKSTKDPNIENYGTFVMW